MFEFEKKIPLVKKEYAALRSMSRGANTIMQTNYYFDTDHFDLDQKNITCRIREKGGKYTATVKEHCIDERNCSRETSRLVSGPSDTALFSDMNVKLQGSMITFRTVLYEGESLAVLLDRNCYLDTVDYEIEIEYVPEMVDRTYGVIACLVASMNGMRDDTDVVTYYHREKESQSKAHRFLKRLRDMQETGELE